jgi:hypothetical protein
MASMVKISRRVRRLAPADRPEGHTSPFPPAVDLRSAVTASGSRGGVVDVELLLWPPTGRGHRWGAGG